MELRELWSALRAGWWIAAVGLVVGGVAALGMSLLVTPQYTTHTQLFISSTAPSSEAFQAAQFSVKRAASYTPLLTGQELAGRVVQRLKLNMTPSAVADEITATSVTDTVLLDVSVTDVSPQRAVRIAETLGTEFAGMVSELEAPQAGAPSAVSVRITQGPQLPAVPSSPMIPRNIGFGLLGGLLVGCAVAVIRGRLDTSVRTVDDACALTGAPPLGVIPWDKTVAKRHVFDWNRSAETAEAYRHLCTNLQLLDGGAPPRTIMISSAIASEGRTTTAINLALALVEVDRKVTIVEADLRRPQVAGYLEVAGGVGLANILGGSADLSDALQPYGDGRLSVLAAGPPPRNPSELLATGQMSTVLAKLQADNDFVLLIAPPLLPVADAGRLAVLSDGVLLCVGYGESSGAQVKAAARKIRGAGARILGVVLGAVPVRAAGRGDATYTYYGAGVYGSATPQGRDVAVLRPGVPASSSSADGPDGSAGDREPAGREFDR
jgi:capsular exopolysaccharide synthesis family protein